MSTTTTTTTTETLERVMCTGAGCTKPGKYLSKASKGPRRPVCASHYHGPCAHEGCTNAAGTGGMCRRHAYGTCGADGCTGSAGGLLDGVALCHPHKYGTCTTAGCPNGAKAIKDGRPVCIAHKYGTCTADECTNSAGAIKDGRPVCYVHKHGDGTCSTPGCHRVAGYASPAGPVCGHHKFADCAVDGCTEKAPSINPLCYTHQRRGADYIKAAGMRADLPGLIYVVLHADLGAIKVGIGIANAGRVGQHLANGWTGVLAIEEGLTIADVRAIENAVLAAWRAAGVPFGALQHHMPQQGYTETAPGTKADAIALAAWVKAGDLDAPVPLPAAFARA